MRLAVAALCHSLHYLASADPLHAIFFFFFNDTATTEIYTLSLHDALPISATRRTSCTRRLSRSSAGSSTRRTAPSWSSAPRRATPARTRRTPPAGGPRAAARCSDRKSTRLNSSHLVISYAVFCLKKKINLL